MNFHLLLCIVLVNIVVNEHFRCQTIVLENAEFI